MEIKGNYEIRIYIIDLDEIKDYSNFKDVTIDSRTEDEEFIEIAEQLGTVYSLGAFIENINNQELDNFSNCYVRACLINVDEPNEVIGIDDFNSLYLYNGEIRQV